MLDGQAERLRAGRKLGCSGVIGKLPACIFDTFYFEDNNGDLIMVCFLSRDRSGVFFGDSVGVFWHIPYIREITMI